MPEIRRYDVELTLVKKNQIAGSAELAVAGVLESLVLDDKNQIKDCIKIKKVVVERSDL